MGFWLAVQDALTRLPPSARTLALGLFAWTVCAVLPTVHRADALSSLSFALLPLAPVTLVLGVFLERQKSSLAVYALLTGFPITLAISLSRFDPDTALLTFSPWVMAFALLSVAAYAVSAVLLCGSAAEARPVDHKPLGEVAPVEPETRKQTFGTLVLCAVTLGALWMLFAQSWASPARLRERWGEAYAEGASLTALVAGVVGAIAIALVGPALRAERGRPPSRAEWQRRLSWLLLVAVSGAISYALSSH